MMYSRDEQETTLVYDNGTGMWSVYSTCPKHIRKLAELTDLEILDNEDGRPTAVKGLLNEKQVSMKKERVMSEEQRQAMSERMSKLHGKKED
ncbi:hypothetical protein AAHH67_15380 [Niallia circulans]|uniref:Uncharacterized protein n=1 Tax=Niallia circulans TaxID=1397 RepID=A0AA91TWC6_NIACI|nr:hypothetical protein [Niallia circulans]PAD85046.1 hypothetical protein CHH57_01670 [Niallia circulans]